MARLRFRLMLGMGAGSGGANFVNSFSNTILPLILESYGFPHFLIGLLAQERSLIGAVVQPAVGAVSDRLRTPLGRRRPFFLLGVPLTAIILAIIATHPPALVMAVAIPFLGLFLALAVDPYNALLVDVATPDERGPLGGIMTATSMAGQIVLLLAAVRLFAHQQPWLFAVIIAGLVIGFGITFLTIREPVEQRQPAARPRWRPTAYVKSVLAEREVAKYAGAMFFFFLGYGASSPFLTQFAVHVLHVSSGTSFVLVLVAVVVTGILAFPMGMLARRAGKLPVLAVGLMAYAVVTLVGSQTRTFGQGLITMIFLGACGAMTGPTIGPLLADMMPRHRAGEFTGLGSLIWSIALPIGAMAAGACIDLTGSYRAVFIFSACMYVVSWMLLRTVRAQAVKPVSVPERLAAAVEV